VKTFDEFLTEAPKRLNFTRVYHGTSPEAAKKIEKRGFNSPEVYASTSKDTAKSFGRRYSQKPKTVELLVPSKRIKPNAPAKAVKTEGQRGTDSWGKEHFSVAVDRDYASRKRVPTTTGIVRAPKTEKQWQHKLPKAFQRRTRTQPKKK
jgi:hypothetical protein